MAAASSNCGNSGERVVFVLARWAQHADLDVRAAPLQKSRKESGSEYQNRDRFGAML
jgi:hypothetical protein